MLASMGYTPLRRFGESGYSRRDAERARAMRGPVMARSKASSKHALYGIACALLVLQCNTIVSESSSVADR